MENLITSFNDGIANLNILGHIDTSNAATLSAEVETFLNLHADCRKVIIDAEELNYISSSGLRILLSIKKRISDTEVLNVSRDVYEVFEMTGFSKILTIKKALRKISIDGCPEIGRGGVGTVYRIDTETIIKVFREDANINDLDHEREMSKEAFVMGMPTAIAYDTVKVGNSYGLVYELLNADTLSVCIKKEPNRLTEFAQMFGNLMRNNHKIEVSSELIEPSKKILARQIEKVRKYISIEAIELLKEILEAIPDEKRLLHGDFHPKNMMLQNGELLLIDMGEVGYGHPLIDLGNTYTCIIDIGINFEKIIGFPIELRDQFWKIFIETYFQTTDKQLLDKYNQQIRIAAFLRCFLFLALSDTFDQATINETVKKVDTIFLPQKEHIRDVIKTFNEFPLF